MRWIVLLAAAALAACGDVTVETFTYDDRHDLALDVHAPPDAADTPAVVVIHGGGWWTGKRKEMARFPDRLARMGYVAATIDYRLVPGVRFPDPVRDAFCALAYVRAHAEELGIDPDRVAVLGYSAGGHLAAMLGVAADVVELQDDGCPSGRTGAPRAVVSGAGPMDLTLLDDETTHNFVGVPYDKDSPVWKLASPVTHVGPGEPPFLLVHAYNDRVVDVAQSQLMYRALRGAGNLALLLELEGGGHAFNDGAGLGAIEYELAIDTPESWMATVDFLAQTVGTP